MISSAIGNAVDELLSRFPGPITLYPARGKWISLTLGAVVFTTIGALGSFARIDAFQHAIMILGTIFFGTCMLAGIITLLPGASSLQLNQDGFAIAKFYWTRRLRWAEVSDFAIWTYRANKVITFNTCTPSSSKAGALLMKINSFLAGRNDYLPDTYGLSANDLLALVNAWRKRAIGSIKAANETEFDRIRAQIEDDGDRSGGRLGG